MSNASLPRRGFLVSSVCAGTGLIAGCTNTLASRPVNGSAPAVGADLPQLASREGQYAEVNGARLFYQSTGTGEPMFLLHGYPLSGALFALARDQLARRFRVITVDHRGYGKSTAPGVPHDIATYANDALALMQQLGIDRAHIGGMSMGGPIMLEMFKQAPQRFRSATFIDTIAAAASPAEAGLWRGVADMIRTGGMDAVIPVLIKEMLTGDARRTNPGLVNYMQGIVTNASQDAGIGGALALATRPGYQDVLSRINVPALVLVGLQDTVYPFEIAQRMQKIIPSAQLAIIDNASHAGVLERADAYAERMLMM